MKVLRGRTRQRRQARKRRELPPPDPPPQMNGNSLPAGFCYLKVREMRISILKSTGLNLIRGFMNKKLMF
jgi:hypothetical protein